MTTRDQQAAAEDRRRQRVTSGEIIRALLERGATEHSSVELTRNARGVVQIAVTCRTGESERVQTLADAELLARETFDRLREQYPFTDGDGPAKAGS